MKKLWENWRPRIPWILQGGKGRPGGRGWVKTVFPGRNDTNKKKKKRVLPFLWMKTTYGGDNSSKTSPVFERDLTLLALRAARRSLNSCPDRGGWKRRPTRDHVQHL